MIHKHSIALSLLGLANAAFAMGDLEQSIAGGDYQQLTSVVVARNGDLLFEQYYNGATASTQHDIRSASKSFTAMAFGLAMADGVLDGPAQPVLPLFADYAPLQNPFPAKTAMTFDALLSMTGPLECNDWEQFSAGNEERMYLRGDWVRFTLDLPERGIPPWQPPAHERPFGNAYSYCTAGVFLTGAAIERATGQALDDYFQQRILDPLGRPQAVWPKTPKNRTQGGGGVRIDSRSLWQIGELMRNGGRVGDRQLIPAEWVASMLTPRAQASADQNSDYGYLWWLMRYDVEGRTVDGWAAAGNGGNYLIIVPELDSVIVITATAYGTSYMHEQARRLVSTEILPRLLQSKGTN